MNNEKGYMTAFSLILSLILISVFLFNSKILNSERQFHEKRLSWFKTNVTLELARDDVFTRLNSGEIKVWDAKTLSYRYGKVDYKVIPVNNDVYVVRLDVDLNFSGKSTGLLYYNYVNNKVVKWVVV